MKDLIVYVTSEKDKILNELEFVRHINKGRPGVTIVCDRYELRVLAPTPVPSTEIAGEGESATALTVALSGYVEAAKALKLDGSKVWLKQDGVWTYSQVE